MPKYRVVRKRAYWVREEMEIEAESPEAAEDEFLDCFNPTLTVEECLDFHGHRFEEPIEIQQIVEPKK